MELPNIATFEREDIAQYAKNIEYDLKRAMRISRILYNKNNSSFLVRLLTSSSKAQIAIHKDVLMCLTYKFILIRFAYDVLIFIRLKH